MVVTAHQEVTRRTNRSTQIRRTGDTLFIPHGTQEPHDAISMICRIDSKYTEEERVYIDGRIDEALKSFEKQTRTSARRPTPKPPARKKIDELTLEDLLHLFAGAARLKRALEMDDSLISISETPTDEISGKVKDYLVRIDLKNHTILHDCEDWRKNMDSKNMCKHLGKFMLSLDEGRATKLLRDVLENKEQWKFTAP